MAVPRIGHIVPKKKLALLIPVLNLPSHYKVLKRTQLDGCSFLRGPLSLVESVIFIESKSEPSWSVEDPSFPIVVNVTVSLISHHIKKTNQLLEKEPAQLAYQWVSVNLRCVDLLVCFPVTPLLLACRLFSAEAKINLSRRLLRVLAKVPRSGALSLTSFTITRASTSWICLGYSQHDLKFFNYSRSCFSLHM